MNYYYAVAGQQKGPISEEELDRMVASGTLRPDTLVWRAGMETWLAYAVVKPGALPSSTPVQPGTSGAVGCSVCHQTYPADQVTQYGTVPVCRNCQPAFLQNLPAGTQFVGSLRYAGFWKRFAAKFVDGLIAMLVLTPAYAAAEYYQSDALWGLYSVLWLFAAFGYPILFVGRWGQTLGKMALKIKVVSPEGAPISYLNAAGRTLAELLSGCLLYVGYIMAAFDEPQKRALHDRLAGTRVIEVD